MSGREDPLEGIISTLNDIRDRIDTTGETPNGENGQREPRQSDDDSTSLALEEYLASRLQQIGEVLPEQKEIKGLKTGNGWNANQVIEQIFKIEPISIKRAVEIAISSNRTLRERLARLFRRRKEERNIIGIPTVEFVPIWKVKGFHECYYLRTSSYRVNVRNDVVGVEVEGQSRDLILERKHLRFIPTAIVDRFQRLGSFLSNESKYFVVSDVMELATKRSESELSVTGAGKPLDLEEEMALTSWRTKRIFDVSDLKARGARANVRQSAMSKEMILAKFREQVVRMPERFKQILSNRLQVTELKRIYVPFIRVPIQRGLVPRDVIINGSSGELAEKRQFELLE
jgi:hypothetical protein